MILLPIFKNSMPRKYASSPKSVISNSDLSLCFNSCMSASLLPVMTKSSTYRHSRITPPSLLLCT
ncbi:hypothetical protein Lalb_Chr16g0377021 [Lupinus albus]|uniref:Uncharacterized protein n=1 Tax=Lupinus albus TaxID=3870 RepID=A0A6A4P9F6_LUPAL|nr:hypothetical protein Lalb_Chr16g0377021 [Lupinus albus]